MENSLSSEAVCHEIVEDLQDVARWFSGGTLTPEQFRSAVTVMEARKHDRLGYRLDSRVAPNGHIKFSLRTAHSNELCASMDIDPMTGDVEVQHTSAGFSGYAG